MTSGRADPRPGTLRTRLYGEIPAFRPIETHLRTRDDYGQRMYVFPNLSLQRYGRCYGYVIDEPPLPSRRDYCAD